MRLPVDDELISNEDLEFLDGLVIEDEDEDVEVLLDDEDLEDIQYEVDRVSKDEYIEADIHHAYPADYILQDGIYILIYGDIDMEQPMSERIFIRYQPNLYFACTDAVCRMMKGLYQHKVYSEDLGAQEIVLANCAIPRLLFMELLNLLNHHEGEELLADHECRITDCIQHATTSLASKGYPVLMLMNAIEMLGADLLYSFL